MGQSERLVGQKQKDGQAVKFGSRLEAPFQEQKTRRQESLVTPFTFSVSLSGTTTVYTGNDRDYLLIRKVLVTNNTGGAVTFRLLVNGNVWVPDVSLADDTVTELAVSGMLIEPEHDITAVGNGLRVSGWGVRAEGGDGWVL